MDIMIKKHLMASSKTIVKTIKNNRESVLKISINLFIFSLLVLAMSTVWFTFGRVGIVITMLPIVIYCIAIFSTSSDGRS